MNISDKHQDAIGSRFTPEITPQMTKSLSLNTNDKHQGSTESPPESAPQMIAPLSFGSLLSFALDNPATGSHPLLSPSSIGDTLPPKSIGDMLSRSFSFVSTGSKSELLKENDSFRICEDNAVNNEDFFVGDDVWERDFASFCDHLDPNQEQGSVSTTPNRVSPGKRPPAVPLLERVKRVKRKWTEAENKRLEEGVKKYGVGNWSPIAKHVGGKRDNRACRQKWVLNLRPEIKVGNKTGAWSKEETEQLRQILSGLDCKDPSTWELASKAMGYNRNIKQIKSRYDNFLDPTLKHGPWTKEEDDDLLSLQSEYGNKWKNFESILVGRSSDRIRRRFIWLSKQRSKNTEFRLWRRV